MLNRMHEGVIVLLGD